ncbi:DUF5994 family protein [Phytoactinopolyspora halotolerans]|uniref:DUF5994 family protein n=1 Tax=Phytoactinopolyspora halotolerans TaxID=1981512 RepID=UPI0024839E4D|nr:DUF5994 family protein [Phytoactinopolyspora halotolerans]
MREFTNYHIADVSTTRVAYRIIRPGQHPRLRGVWWPRSLDLSAELPALIDALDSRGFMTEQVSFSPASWIKASRQVPVAGRIIRLDPSPLADSGMVTLSGRQGRTHIVLAVLPPRSRRMTVARAFERVLDWDGSITASDVSAGTTSDVLVGTATVR